MLEMCKNNHFIISDYGHMGCDNGTSTYMSAAHHTSSWLDHSICSHSSHNTINDITVLELPHSSDHQPVGSNFCHQCITAFLITDCCLL